jgi:ubiquinone/menaquinone biosynthesis C-methylase UbiE
MIGRALEPEAMDTPEEARDYDGMDHGGVNRVFVADFVAVWDGTVPILDTGCGTAQIPIELCRQAPGARVVALDMAEHMLAVAKDNVRTAGLAERIQLERGDAKKLSHADRSFAAVMSNSIVHHIPEPGQVLAEMVRVVRAGGLIFVRDLLRPETEPELDHLVRTYAGDANAHQRQMFADSLRAALNLTEIRQMVSSLGCHPSEVRQTTDRHWTWVTHRS